MADNDLLVQLARFIERVSATARTGLAFSNSGFDRERYDDMLHEAARMRASIEGVGEAEADMLRTRWQQEVIAGYEGYVTPGVGCGMIAFNDRDEVLMIKRTSGRWWYPTGFCEPGISPAENITKEALEETGMIVKPIRLMAVADSFKHGWASRHLYTVLFYCRIEGGELRPHPLEVLDVGFYPLDDLPSPLHGKDHGWIALARDFHFGGRTETYFE